MLLGLNGAGKSTAMKTLCGAVTPTGGEIRYRGENIVGWSTAACVKAGLVMVPEGRHVFGDLNVERNLQVGSWTQRGDKKWVEEQREYVYKQLPRLDERRKQQAGKLSGGEQQMLAIGRGLMAKPAVLVIDEASLGLAPVIVKEILKIARRLGRRRHDGVAGRAEHRCAGHRRRRFLRRPGHRDPHAARQAVKGRRPRAVAVSRALALSVSNQRFATEFQVDGLCGRPPLAPDRRSRILRGPWP